MDTIVHPASERGHANFGWLDTYHSFNFGRWYNPVRTHFGALRVINDDYVLGGAGFPEHPHDNMEIVSIPLSGALAHKDNSGGEGVIRVGDVQAMSAGSGIQHSEYNASKIEMANFLQIWVYPKLENIKPRYDQRSFDEDERRNKWQVIVSPYEKDNALWINQDAVFSLCSMDAGSVINYKNKFTSNGVYIYLIDGSIEVVGKTLEKRDAIGINGTDGFNIKAANDSYILAIEVPMIGED